MYKLSICFCVYNQSEILFQRLSQLVKCRREDVEIVISDDCSTEDIEAIVSGFNDRRIKYYRTEKNVGHDLNILHALRCCQSDYAYIFRTRDQIYIENIDKIIETVEYHQDVGLFYFSAIDEKGNYRLRFNTILYRKERRFEGYCTIPNHPSGNLYYIKSLNIGILEQYMKEYFDDIYGFTVHALMKIYLSSHTDLYTSNEIGWIYTDTLKSKDVAVNRTKNGVNVYAFQYSLPRYICEFEFAKREVEKELRTSYLKEIIGRGYYSVIYKSRQIIRDKRYMAHYGSSVTKQRGYINCLLHMNRVTKQLLADVSKEETFKLWKCVIWNNVLLLLYYPIVAIIRKAIINTFVYRIYRRYIGNKKRGTVLK